MAKGSKEKYTDKQKRQARHIEIGYEREGIGKREARAARGRPSTRLMAAATNRVAPATVIDEKVVRQTIAAPSVERLRRPQARFAGELLRTQLRPRG